MVKNLSLALGLGLTGCLALANTTLAADKEAEALVAEMASTRDAVMKRYPSLRMVDGAVRTDCAAKAKDESPNGAFCSCASAVVFGLWDSDGGMKARFTKFNRAPSTEAAAAFAAELQGPELYGPLCRKAT